MLDHLAVFAARLCIWLIGHRTVYVECERLYASTAARERVMLAVVNQNDEPRQAQQQSAPTASLEAIGFQLPNAGGDAFYDDKDDDQ